MKPNLVIAGPAGVGKTAAAKCLVPRLNLTALDFDELRQRHGDLAEFRLQSLDLVRCLPTLMTHAPHGFILDIGGGTVFRASADNSARLSSMLQFKTYCAASVFLLTATKDVVFARYVKKSGSSPRMFDADWADWVTREQAYWIQCADITLDTSSLDPCDVAMRIELDLKAR